MEQVRKSYEGKQKLMKNRLILAIGAGENMSLEDAVKVACDILIEESILKFYDLYVEA